MTLGVAFIIGIHALVAWILIEAFVNFSYGLSRISYVIWHYVVIVAAFAGIFLLYNRFFDVGESAFDITLVGMSFVLFFELVVFRYLYSGERWFLNWVDWILPIFLATTTIYATVTFW
jgi:hypothetical protein